MKQRGALNLTAPVKWTAYFTGQAEIRSTQRSCFFAGPGDPG